MTVAPSRGALPRLSRFNHAQISSQRLARGVGQPSALFVGTHPGLALALGRLAEFQHLPLTIFWSLQALSEAVLLSAEVLIVDWSIWQDLQSRQYQHLASVLAAMPVVLVVTAAESALLPPQVGEHVHVALLPATHAAASVLLMASQVLKLG